MGELRNPWVCTVKYPVGASVRYRVVIDPNGQVHGVNGDRSLTVYGVLCGISPVAVIRGSRDRQVSGLQSAHQQLRRGLLPAAGTVLENAATSS
jgi:hypothetical protein